jgi:hypothetical protein
MLYKFESINFFLILILPDINSNRFRNFSVFERKKDKQVFVRNGPNQQGVIVVATEPEGGGVGGAHGHGDRGRHGLAAREEAAQQDLRHLPLGPRAARPEALRQRVLGRSKQLRHDGPRRSHQDQDRTGSHAHLSPLVP